MDGSTVIDKSLFKLSCFSREEENKMKEMGKGEKKGKKITEFMSKIIHFSKKMVRIIPI